MNNDRAALELLDEITAIARSGDVQGTLLKVADIIADYVEMKAKAERLADAESLLQVADKAIPDFSLGLRNNEFRDGYRRFKKGDQVIGLSSWQDGRDSMRKERDDLQQRLADAERRNSELLEVLKMARFHVSMEGTQDECDRIDAALTKPEEAKS